ncbi:ABC transporter ATP-binding protein [Evansella halocellulosilytica]|uniref:ABC transporter ATP-binding protein n=1 Tax=Evansella halocellulosilytica TaxID=2011013 RepID=UPI000BB6AE66|nr:ABC transporter ATP-binding protein [Evansella halocellulosilytica]
MKRRDWNVTDILEIKDLEVAIPEDDGDVNIVNGISLSVSKGKTLGIVGESGCGKSLTSLSIMGLLPKNLKINNGSIQLDGRELTTLSKNERRKLRGKDMAMIFQEPMTSLNPVFKIGYQIVEIVRNHKDISKKEAYRHALHMLKLVGIPRAEEVINDYPHQLSGGMRQRVMIALALSCYPKLLIADEPTTALDVTIQAQILELMRSLQDEMNMSIVLITHDLGVVAEACDDVAVMYAGDVVERSTVDELFEEPKHPYTKGLLSSIPDIDEEVEILSSIPGTVPSPHEMPRGCRFADRCPEAFDYCFKHEPEEFKVKSNSSAKCWLYSEEVVRHDKQNKEEV